MIHNPKFDLARKQAFEKDLRRPRSSEFPSLICRQCAFYSTEHFLGEDEIDCFTEMGANDPKDTPFTCLCHSKSLFDSGSKACLDFQMERMQMKFKAAVDMLAQIENN